MPQPPAGRQRLSRSIAVLQREAYRRSPALRARLAIGQELAESGELILMASAAQLIFGVSPLSGVLLDELTQATGRFRGEEHGAHRRNLAPRWRL